MSVRVILLLTLLAAVITLLPIEIIIHPAEASGFDEALEFAKYLCERYLSCE